MPIHFLVCVISLLAVGKEGAASSLTTTFPFALLALVCFGRVILIARRMGGNPILLTCIVPGIMWLWYFSPAFIYTFDSNELPDVLIFDESYLVESMGKMLSYYSLFTAGIEMLLRRGSVQAGGQMLGTDDEQRLTLNGVIVVAILVVALGGLAYVARPDPVLDEVANFIDVYEDTIATSIANRFTSVVVVWAMCLGLLVRNVIYGSSPLWLIAALPGIVSITIAIAGTGRRQALLFAAVVAFFPLIQSFRRSQLPYLAAIFVTLVFGLALVDARRSSVGGAVVDFSVGDIIRRPLLNFANTASFHARCVYYYSDNNYLWGKSFIINPVPAVPLLSKLVPGDYSELERYSLLPVRATLSFAYDRRFGMGGSPFSELYANFSLFGLPFAFLYGALYGKWVGFAWTARGRLSSSVLASVLLLFMVWNVRSSLQGSIGMLRFVLVGIILVSCLQLTGLVAGRGQSSTSPSFSGRKWKL